MIQICNYHLPQATGPAYGKASSRPLTAIERENMKTKLWLGVGSAVLLGSALNTNPDNQIASAFFSAAPAFAQEAEGGEGGEGGGSNLVTSYALNSTDPDAFKYDAAPQTLLMP
jgi:hypothetical protein